MNDTEQTAQAIRWIAADWGTSRLRVWAMDENDAVLAQRHSDKGMGSLRSDGYEPALLELTEDWLTGTRPVQVIACGMVGARQGWIEAPYHALPCKPAGAGKATLAPVKDQRLQVRILAGLSQDEPADVMRGEETQIAGLLDQMPEFEGIICMPGTHTKWVRVKHGQVLSFRSCMTGELFALLEKHSVLRHSLRADGFDTPEFEATIKHNVDTKESGLLNLFAVRANDLLHGTGADLSRARLSAHLIHAEIESARALWVGASLVLLGAQELVELYRVALRAAGANPQIVDATGLTLRGLCAARGEIRRMHG